MSKNTEKQIILLADEQYLIRFALRKLLEQFHWNSVVVDVASEEVLLLSLERYPTALILLDYLQPGSFSLETIARIHEKAPQARILIISSDHNRETIYQSLEYGIDAFLTKNCDETEILDAITAVGKNERFYCSRVIDFLLEKSFPRTSDSCSPTTLSKREIEIVQLTAQGLVAKQIADTLNISTHTVYTHRKNILQKLNVKNASELVLLAVNKGWVERD